MPNTTDERPPRGLRGLATMMTRWLRTFPRMIVFLKIAKAIVKGRHNVPPTGAVLIACNHISILDPIYLWGALRRNGVAVAMAELWRIWIVSWVMRIMGHIPIQRKNPASAARMIAACIRVLNHGGLIIIYPEGKCSETGELLPLKDGVAQIVYGAEVPVTVIQAYISGTNRVLPLKKWLPRLKHTVYLTFDTPLDPASFTTHEEFLAALEARFRAMAASHTSI